MLPKKNNITVLVAPLDWGLGHATRCIPIIRALALNGCTILIATSGRHQILLQQEFPHLRFLELPGYGIKYGKANVLLRLLLQLPFFFRNVRQEHQWLQQKIADFSIDAVISDNRYGLHSPKIPCVFITHQLQVQSPPILKMVETSVRNKLYHYIKNFTTCWVPDLANKNESLGKALSHPKVLPAIPVNYIGWLTRFFPQPALPTKYTLLISLSGPEPQRSLLETLLIPQLYQVKGNVLLVRGLPGNANSPINNGPSNVTIINHLPGKALQTAIGETEFFMSRCGYSTLMDLQAVRCRCIFVPTPGQTEQEYLGRQIAATGNAVVMSQNNINLQQALQKASVAPFFSEGNYINSQLENILKQWLSSIIKA